MVWLHNLCFSQQTILNFGAFDSSTYRSPHCPQWLNRVHLTAIYYSFPRLLAIHILSPTPTLTRTRCENFESYNIWEFRLNNWFYPYYTRQIKRKAAEFVLIFLSQLNSLFYFSNFLVAGIQIQFFYSIHFFSTFSYI